jgi:predicted SAM-dependent methyltransferase
MRLKRDVATKAPKIVIGSGRIPIPGWIGTDVDTLNILQVRDWSRYFAPGSIEAMLAEHVWEHLTATDAEIALRNCYTYLRKDGRLRIAVPDGFHPDPSYREYVRPGGVGLGADDHKVLYDHESLTRLLHRVGFETRGLEYWDQAGTFHFTEWDPADGPVRRSKRFDSRNADGQLRYTSLIVDATKPA